MLHVRDAGPSVPRVGEQNSDTASALQKSVETGVPHKSFKRAAGRIGKGKRCINSLSFSQRGHALRLIFMV